MSAGPLRRAIGLAGLVALVPVLIQLASGSITPEDAAVRGLVVAAAVVVLGRATQFALTAQLRRMERREQDRQAGPGTNEPVERRR